MKSTVLFASKKIANQVSNDLLSKTFISEKSGKTLNSFERVEITNGFEIKSKGKHKVTGEQITVFRFTDDNGRKKMEYNEQLLNFDFDN